MGRVERGVVQKIDEGKTYSVARSELLLCGDHAAGALRGVDGRFAADNGFFWLGARAASLGPDFGDAFPVIHFNVLCRVVWEFGKVLSGLSARLPGVDWDCLAARRGCLDVKIGFTIRIWERSRN